MTELLVMIAVLVVTIHVLQVKVGLSSSDLNTMFLGAVGFAALKAISILIIMLFTVIGGGTVASGIVIAHLIGLILNGGLAYFFFKKSGL